MSFHPTASARVALAVAVAAGLAAACGGYDYSVESELNQATSGQLTQDAFLLRYSPGNSWDQGHCLDLTLTNQGRPVYWWTLTLELDQPIETLGTIYGASIEVFGDRLVINPTQGALAYNDSVDFQLCIEPGSVPTRIVELTYDAAEDQATPTEPGDATPTARPGEDDEPSTPDARAIKDEPLFLVYRHSNTSRGGGCIDIEITNGGTQDIKSWSMVLTLDDDATVTDWWGALNPVWWQGERVQVLPEEWALDLKAFESIDGTICLKPRSDIVGVQAQVEFEKTDP